MDLKNLTTFIQVAETNSFTQAGKRLGYSQPTISLQIKQLEDELGVKLFDRIGHTVRLTDKGHAILLHAQQICQLCQEIGENDLRREQQSLVRVGMADSLCFVLVGSRYPAFRRAFPNISIQITTGDTNDLFRMLDHNEVDVVCTLDSHIYNTNYIIAGEEQLDAHIIVSANHPLAAKKELTADDLLTETFLLTEKGMSYRRILDEWLAQTSHELQPVLEIGSAHLICELVEKGVGISFLPDYVTETAAHKGTIVRLSLPELNLNLWKQVIHHREKWLSPPIEAVIHHLSEPILAAF